MNGTNKSEKIPVTIPIGMIKTTDKIKNINKNAILIGMLNINKPAEKIFNSKMIPKTTRRTENISILISLLFHVISRN